MRRAGAVAPGQGGEPFGLPRSAWLTAKAGLGRAATVVERLRARGKTLDVRWFDGWDERMATALASMPELPNCPHDLYRRLLSEPSSVPRRWALVSEHGDPVAVAGLRRKGKRWEPICQGVCPGAYIAAKPGYLIPALKALRLPIIVQYWENEPVPPGARNVVSYAAHRFSCAEGEGEAYWKRAGTWKAIRNIRQRTREFNLEIDGGGASHWVLNGWAAKWADHPWHDVITLDAMRLAVDEWKPAGRLRTFRLMDGQTPAAGLVCLAEGPRLVLLTIYRDPAYDWHGVGIRILDAVCLWAREAGFGVVDLGGGAEYKARLAPASGTIWEFELLPLPLFVATRFSSSARRVARKAGRTAERVRGRRPGVAPHQQQESPQ
jgi:GNAT superfamily N-acetyltransferase